MSWEQVQFSIPGKPKGIYIITDDVLRSVPQIKEFEVGILHLFIKHTSAALTINENWDSAVLTDVASTLDRLVPKDVYYEHEQQGEGKNDAMSHSQSVLVGPSLSIPIKNGRLALGTWQGIYLCEFRVERHSRTIIATINGKKK
ncbi:hypothetical protein Cantr_05307 [Candida viswanathii]|uniref:Uncharacterized protein n=1 Tax=Candida viswanathii TaxID=5486 RepID=A0A367XSU8_9ASCO|nr:hypothetical protein Cantr_05307 [Candida viswanathii]